MSEPILEFHERGKLIKLQKHNYCHRLERPGQLPELAVDLGRYNYDIFGSVIYQLHTMKAQPPGSILSM
ncbi:hypothetical protein M6B38_204950 [Iris pallida]|uniref:Uncharacterized protein n=1 Tax=Iris pallida TaxID=29817 RepID=A0AAX6E7U5_IRIPA|nr:hypothetical protein M6B38_204950 [Iris pallida]